MITYFPCKAVTDHCPSIAPKGTIASHGNAWILITPGLMSHARVVWDAPFRYPTHFTPWLATSSRSVTTPKVNYCAAIICPASQSHHEWLNDPEIPHLQPAKIWHRTQARALRKSMVVRRVQWTGIDTPDSLNHAQGVSLPFCERVISWPKHSMPRLWHVIPDLHL